MVSLHPLFLYLHKFVELSHDEFDQYLKPYIQVRHFKKREIITSTGEVEQFFNFILEGLALKYYKQDGEEHIVQIATEGQIIHAQESFHSRTPSEYTIEALEPTAIASISFDDLEQIYSSNHKMERLGRLVITFSFVSQNKWQMLALKLTPRERFLKFMERNPELLQRVPQKYLASYLNIQPETFSRFKHILREKK
ncbi:Crp/Fnr family transcriptional regulator [Flavisolibacter tropicus]|uniref:Cyclic nucleotide-binding protein n=1 Tax=Flavisolibacter tropicus TaxID=1492898 RepID=A0A172TT22_9BACT|nr:Crp/Fnr family transcriptional regulator [Flavisolibacter tropicus]ANE50235.1 cyclic nucleotide-binding protein [Flavisolibacter tropicus]